VKARDHALRVYLAEKVIRSTKQKNQNSGFDIIYSRLLAVL